MGLFSSTKREQRSQNFVTEFLRVSGVLRTEMIGSLHRNTNRLLLVPRGRAISEELRNRKAPFQALYDFETGLARAIHPGRRWHPGAQYFYAAYFKDRVVPYQTALHNLSAAGQLTGPGLVPLLARMDFSEGRSFVLLFLEDVLRGLAPGLAQSLKRIELDHHRLKDNLDSGADQSTTENTLRVRHDFEAFQSKTPELAQLYIKRAQADPVLEPYVSELRRLTEVQTVPEPGTPETGIIPDYEQFAPESDAADPTGSPATGLNPEPLESSAVEATATIDSDDANETLIEETVAAIPSDEQIFEDQTNTDASSVSTEASESVFALSPEQSDDDPDLSIAPAPEIDISGPIETETGSSESAGPVADPAFDQFLEARRAEMQDIERRLGQDLEQCQKEIESIGRIADPAERVDESSAALLGDDVYQHYRLDLQEILSDADQLFARIFALLSKLSRRLTVAEMRRFVDHLIQELEKDAAICAREPHLIPRLKNYRNSLKEEAPQLLNQIHARLAEIRREHKGDAALALGDQLDYLQACLTDAVFRSIWPTIFTIYQNLVAQQFDAHVFREIADHLPLERQQRVLASLREGFREGSPARAAIDRKLRGTELAGIGERMQRESSTGEIEELPEILARLESNHHFDPVERVRQEIRDFDAGRPSHTQTPETPVQTETVAGSEDSVMNPAQETGWTVERTRVLHRTHPAEALEFAARALSAGEVDVREKELLCEYIEELSEQDAAMARLYIFHRSVESAGKPRDQLAMIRKFQDLLPAEIIRTRETNLRRAVARAPVPAQLMKALKETSPEHRKIQLNDVFKNPHLPAGLRPVLRARRDTSADTAFNTAFESICISPHPTQNKIQLLQTLGALARARDWLTPQRVRKLEDRIRLYRRISQANQQSIARNSQERRYFIQDIAQVIQMLRAGRPPAEILQRRDRQLNGNSDPAQAHSQTTSAASSAARNTAIGTSSRNPSPSGSSSTGFSPATASATGTSNAPVSPGNISQVAASDTGVAHPAKTPARVSHSTASNTSVTHRRASPVRVARTAASSTRSSPAGKSNTGFASPKISQEQLSQTGSPASPIGIHPQEPVIDDAAAIINATLGEEPKHQLLDEDFMNTPIELEHTAPTPGSRSKTKAGNAPTARPKPGTGTHNRTTETRSATGSGHRSPNNSGPNPKANQGSGTKPGAAAPGFFGKIMNRVTGKPAAGSENDSGKQETISIARLTTRAEKQFMKGDRRNPQQLLEILHTPEDLLELLKSMPEMKKNPANKRDKAAEAIKAALAVTVVIPKNNRVLGMPGSLCFPRKDWNNELKRKNLIKSLNALAEKQLPGSEKFNYYKFLSEEIQFNYYQGKYKHGRI